VANHSDIIDGIELHLIQENNDWWKTKIEKNFKIIHNRGNHANTLYMYEVFGK